MEIKTIQEWIEYAENIEQTSYNGEDVYNKKLIALNDDFIKELDDVFYCVPQPDYLINKYDKLKTKLRETKNDE